MGAHHQDRGMTAPYEKYVAALNRLDRLPAQATEDANRLEQHTSDEAEAARAEERGAKDAARQLREQAQHAVDRARKAAARVELDDYLPTRVPPERKGSSADADALQATVGRVEQRVAELERARQVASEQARAQAEEAKRLERERQRAEEEHARLAEVRRRRRRILLGICVTVVLILLVILGQFTASGAVVASAIGAPPSVDWTGPSPSLLVKHQTEVKAQATSTPADSTNRSPNPSEAACHSSNN